MNLTIDSRISGDTPLFSISAAAKMLGITVHTLRMYEKEGLIIPHKETGHNRLYSQNDIERLACIRTAIKEKKFSIAAIKTIYSFLPCWKIINCPVKHRKKCKAYFETVQPCWMYRHVNTFCSDKKCRTCVVYNNYNDCNQIKSEINKLLG